MKAQWAFSVHCRKVYSDFDSCKCREYCIWVMGAPHILDSPRERQSWVRGRTVEVSAKNIGRLALAAIVLLYTTDPDFLDGYEWVAHSALSAVYAVSFVFWLAGHEVRSSAEDDNGF